MLFAVILAFVLVVVLPTGLLADPLRRVFRCTFPSSAQLSPLLWLSLSPPIFLVLFAAITRLVGHYEVSFPLTLLLLWMLRKGVKDLIIVHKPRAISRGDWLEVGIAVLFLAFVWFVRCQWGAITWDNDFRSYGIEKIFNLSMQQAFVGGVDWPPQNPWLAGEPLNYYFFIKGIPGLMSWMAEVLLSQPGSGGAVFLLFDAFVYVGTTMAVYAWVVLLCSLLPLTARIAAKEDSLVQAPPPPNLARVFGFCAAGTVAFISHFKAFADGWKALVQNTPLDWYPLQSDVAPYVLSQYPVWSLMLGDSHSYLIAPLFLVPAIGLGVLVSLVPLAFALWALLGVISLALVLSHASSIFCLAAIVAVGFSCHLYLLLRKREYGEIGISLLGPLLAFLCAIGSFYLVGGRQPESEVGFHWIKAQQSTPALAFLGQVGVLIGVAILMAGMCEVSARLVGVRKTSKRMQSSIFEEGSIVLLAALSGAAVFSERPTLGLLGSVAVLFLWTSRGLATGYRGALVATLVPWIIPELFVWDFLVDGRVDWIRFNTVLRTWYEAWFLLPTVLLPLFFWNIVGKNPAGLGDTQARAVSRILWIFSALLVAVLGAPHIKPLLHRSAHAIGGGVVNGYSWIEKDAPGDFALISWLVAHRQGKVLAETCGVGLHKLAPRDFGPPGRISAFTGVPALCGWAMHTWRYQQKYSNGSRAGEWVWPSFVTLHEVMEEAFSAKATKSTAEKLKALSATHLVVGELERKVYGTRSLKAIAEKLGGSIEFTAADERFGVIELR